MKLAVVTGASSGIGAATATELVARGYKVVLVARGQEKLAALAATLGANAVVEACDAGDGAAVLRMAKRVLDRDGIPDAIVNAAGAGEWKWIEDTSPEEALQMMQAPYFAAFNVTHAFMPSLLSRRAGVVVHVGSPASLFPWSSSTGYSAARWALRGLNEALAQDLAGTGVSSCHAIFGRVDSDYFRTNAGTEEKIPGIAKTIRTMKPAECATKIAGLLTRPRREATWPWTLSVYHLTYALTPWLVRALLRWTGTRHPSAAKR